MMGGGIERYYLNFILLNKEKRVADIDILTTTVGKRNIVKMYPLFPADRIIAFPTLNNRFSFFISKLFLTYYLIKYKLVHIANFESYFTPLYYFMSTKTKVTLNIIDCRFEPELDNGHYETLKELISSSALVGIYSWYKNAEGPIRRLNPSLYFKAAQYCFTDNNRFKPADKRNIIVFAARITMYKRADHFINAVRICLEEFTELFAVWEFTIWGDGPMKEQIEKMLKKLNLNKKIKIGHCRDMSEIFNLSSIFVSTQMYENFTSLSMLEAMAAGNAIIAYNVGQTEDFVKSKENGILVEEDPRALALAMKTIVESKGLCEKFQSGSYKLARELHTITNFTDEIFSFWDKSISCSN